MERKMHEDARHNAISCTETGFPKFRYLSSENLSWEHKKTRGPSPAQRSILSEGKEDAAPVPCTNAEVKLLFEETRPNSCPADKEIRGNIVAADR